MKDIQKQRVVIIGGGNGSAFSINAFKPWRKDFDISAVVSMSDSGGSTGRLRQEFDCQPPGDVMRAILAMSIYDYDILRNIFFRNRFTEGKLERHNLGNMFLVLASEYTKNYFQTIGAFEQAVEAIGHVYPNTLEKNDLVAELNNGEVVVGETFIDRPRHPREWRIKKVWLQPKVKIFDEARSVLELADYIIFSPGSLYTSVIATILPDGFKDAIAESKAKLVYICGPAYEVDGETGPIKLSEAVSELESYLPRKLDLVVYNSHKYNKLEKMFYDKNRWAFSDMDFSRLPKEKTLGFDFEKKGGGICSDKISKNIKKILYQ